MLDVFIRSFEDLKNYKVIIPLLLDIITFFVFGGIYGVAFYAALPHLEKISVISGTQLQAAAAAQTQNEIMKVSAGMVEFYFHYNSLIKIIFLSCIATLVIWNIFQGAAWYFTQQLIRKNKLIKFYKRFCVVSIVAFVILILLVYIIFKLLSFMSVFEVNFTGTIPYIILLLGIATMYFTVMLINTANYKSLFNPKKIAVFLILITSILLIIVLISIFVKYLGDHGINPILLVPIIILPFPLFTYARLCIINICKD